MSTTITQQNPVCPECGCTHTVKKGKRRADSGDVVFRKAGDGERWAVCPDDYPVDLETARSSLKCASSRFCRDGLQWNGCYPGGCRRSKPTSSFAKGLWVEVSEWELRAKAEGLAAIAALPETATFQQMTAATRAVGKRVAKEYEHNEAKARAAREAEQAKARLEAEADAHLYRVFSYLSKLETDPNGWDFEGKLLDYAKRE